ncbi:hypothetical protein [Aquamicrobium sp. LC103]|uniref:hypothetical protein n=1 Tax=Aquamicrobium sp. LC103 TaxID=1120658 RepID=UPI00109C42D8|nr:hypothetical protein [Aquamicrobium sp. LC103]TKT80083.1 hypothetical protein XW59_006940 [Aquamicrobium sp. LC103]
MQEAVEIQKAFEERFGDKHRLLSVGIGLNRSMDDLAINVCVSRPNEAEHLPKNFNGLDVVVDIVGTIRAY